MALPMRWLVALCLLLASAAATVAQEARIAAVVNSEVITDDDVNARLTMEMRSSGIPDTPENRKRLGSRVLHQLIDEKLELQEAKRIGVSAPTADVDRALARLEERNHMPKGGLDKYLAQIGVSRATLVDQITAAIAWEHVVSNQLSADVTVSDQEVQAAMDRLKADVGKPESRVAEIFLAIDNPSQAPEVEQLANRLIDQIRAGANFLAVAQQFSQSPSAAVGGDIGWVTPSELSPLLGEAIQKMEPGQMSYPIHTPAGYYILYLMQRQTLGQTSPDEIHLSMVEVVFPLSPTATPEERQRVTAQAQSVADTAKSCTDMAKLGTERAPQLSRQLPNIKAGDLPPDERQQVLALAVGKASKPMPLRGGIGVAMVCQRQAPPSLPTTEELRSSLGHQRLDALARRYMSNLRRGAYIDIRNQG